MITKELNKIEPETELEYRIINSKVFEKACEFSKSKGPGHPEKNTGEHIRQALSFIDSQNWEDYRNDLRSLALLHDLGKYRTEYNEKGNLITNGHAFYSQEIAKDFVLDENFLNLIKIHDKYFGFYKNNERDKFKEDKFVKTYSNVDLNTLIRFNYSDSNNRETDSIIWFEDKLCDLGMRNKKVYVEDLI
tara:strand:+ start:925 stop:1494 length:570 start_codon:yes stop_codon:yes gene_type:complete